MEGDSESKVPDCRGSCVRTHAETEGELLEMANSSGSAASASVLMEEEGNQPEGLGAAQAEKKNERQGLSSQKNEAFPVKVYWSTTHP